MKTFKGLYIDTQGVLKSGMFPAEPKRPTGWETKGGLKIEMGGDFGYTNAMEKYHKALQAAKDSGIEVQLDFVTGDLLSGHLPKPCQPDTIHPLPSGWEVEVKQVLEIYGDNSYLECEQVAVLIPPPSSEQELPTPDELEEFVKSIREDGSELSKWARWTKGLFADRDKLRAENEQLRRLVEQKEESQEDRIPVYSTPEGLYIKPSELFALKRVQDLILKISEKRFNP